MPEIGLSGLALDFPYSGTAVYTHHLASLLPSVAADLDFRLFVRRGCPESGPVRVQRLTSPIDRVPIHVSRQLAKFAWEEAALPLASALRGQRLLHSLYFAAPAIAACPVVVTVHDVIPLVLPGYHRTRQSSLYSAFMARVVRRAAAIITVSEHSRQDILRVLAVPGDQVHVTYEAADDRFQPTSDAGERDRLLQRYGLAGRFVLYTGGADRRKGLDTLIRAWARVSRQMRNRDVSLVIVARFPPPDHLYPDIPRLAHELGLSDRDVRFIPAVAEEDKPALYRAALMFCFPSTYEGFGLPPLEAMASGTPVIASDATSVPEIVASGGLLLPPNKPALWADAILELVDSDAQRTAWRDAGVARAAAFSWRRTAEETATVYRQILR